MFEKVIEFAGKYLVQILSKFIKQHLLLNIGFLVENAKKNKIELYDKSDHITFLESKHVQMKEQIVIMEDERKRE